MPERNPFARHVYRRRLRGKGNQGRGETFPFDELADGQWRHVRPTIDFDATQMGFKSAIYSFAARYWIRGEVKLHDDGTVTFRLGPFGPQGLENRRDYYTEIIPHPSPPEHPTMRVVAGPGTRSGPDLFPGQVPLKS